MSGHIERILGRVPNSPPSSWRRWASAERSIELLIGRDRAVFVGNASSSGRYAGDVSRCAPRDPESNA